MSQTTLGATSTFTTDAMSAGSAVLTSTLNPFNASMVGYNISVANAAAGTTSGANGTITIAQKILTTASNIFTSGMVGLWVKVPGAGPAAGDLITTIAVFTNPGSVTLTDAAGTSVTTAVITVYNAALATTIASFQSAGQVTLNASPVVAVLNQSVTVFWGGSVTMDTSAYPYVVFESPLSGGDTVTVKVNLPDGMTAVVANDINGVNTGLSGTNPARVYTGGPTYLLTKVGTASQAPLYVDLGTRTV